MSTAEGPNALEEIIAAMIRRDGPMSVERYWDLALFHPEHGYYTSRDPFGAAGDFVTAPEISQMFGELIGAWVLAAWHRLGRPSPFVFAEIGPGRGTLMADMLRTVRRLDPAFLRAARIGLVETSDRLARVQAHRLAAFDLPIRHVRRLDALEAGPLLLVANELFDAVAIRQFVMAEDGWRERCVGLAEDGRLAFLYVAPNAGMPESLRTRRPVSAGASHPPLPAGISPSGREISLVADSWPISPFEGEMSGRTERGASGEPSKFLVPPGTVLEVSPQRLAIADAIAARTAAHGGAALMIDYGHARSGYGDTLQAMRHHAFAGPLETPGECDVTSHVDFASIAARFDSHGLAVAPTMDQGEFLLRLGLAERAGTLGRGRPACEQATIEAAARRLAGGQEDEMGILFKVLAVSSQPLDLPPFMPGSAD